MAEANRSLSACLRCRKKKLKCGGPSQVPCQRCRTTRAECVFVAPKPIRSTSGAPAVDINTGNTLSDKLVLLEQRLESMEARHEAQMREMQNTLSQLVAAVRPSSASDPGASVQRAATQSGTPSERDIVARGVVSESEWEELYEFFYNNCRDIVAFVDDQIYPPQRVARRHPLMSTFICAISARAIRHAKYPAYLAEMDELVKKTFVGATPDIQSVIAVMLLSAWTGRTRLWGYVASLSAELGLNIAALQLGDETIEHTASLVHRARTWFTLCCFDLTLNLSRPFVINKMREYLPLANNLLRSSYCRPVDYRICAYISGFSIAADAKAQFPKAQLQLNPLKQAEIDLLRTFDQKIDQWFCQINSASGAQCQHLTQPPYRSGLLISYAFMKIYINGTALHGMEPESASKAPDTNRLEFLQKALDNASLLIRTQFESDNFRRRLRYTLDYKGVPTYQAISFILKAIPAAHQYLQCGESVTALHQAAQMFEEAGCADAARDVRREQKKIAQLTQIILPSTEEATDTTGNNNNDNSAAEFASSLNSNTIGARTAGTGALDIPTFLDSATWDEPFPILDLFMFD